jgi:putative transposase
MNCKYCQSTNTIRFGAPKGVQRYWCKDCKRKFVPDTLPKMKTPAKIVASALGQYYGGMPLDSIQRQLQQDYGLSMSEVGIYKWISRFSEQAVKQAKAFRPKVGDVWIADETVLHVGGRQMWFWDIIDERSRFLLATRLSNTRTIKDAESLMWQAYERADKVPKKILTDKLNVYLEGIERVFGGDTRHIQTSPFGRKGGDETTSIIERFHGTLKDRTNLVRGFKSLVKSKLITDAWLVHYNFFKEHTALGDIPPAQKMGIPVPFKDWREVVEGTAPQPEVLANAPAREVPAIIERGSPQSKNPQLSRMAAKALLRKTKKRRPIQAGLVMIRR